MVVEYVYDVVVSKFMGCGVIWVNLDWFLFMDF